jgi:acetolactate synthase-1/2/3 large subunit
MKVSDYLVDRVADLGVRHVFFVPGGAAMHLNDSLGGCSRLEFVANLHEQASAIAAEGYARVTNDLGVAMVTAGPGGTNAVTGVAGAWLDSSPVLFLSGQVKRADLKGDTGLRQLGVQEIDIVSIVRPITKYAVTITDPAQARFHFEKAIHLARSGRRGPVWLDVPLDVQASQIDPAGLAGYEPDEQNQEAGSERLPARVSRVLEMLDGAQRPVLLAGNGIRLAGAAALFRDLIDRIGIPVLTTWLGLDLLPDSHPLMIGRPGSVAPRGANFALQNADFLLSVGARLDMALTGYAHNRLARAARKVVVDIDPAEIRKLKTRIEEPIVSDAGAFLRQLDGQLGERPAPGWQSWVERCQRWKESYPVVLPEHRSRRDTVSTYAFSEALSEELAEGDVVVSGSSGSAIEIFLLAFRVKEDQRVFHNRGLGAMGFGLPHSIGACLASGRRRTVCVDGDGGFQFNIQELETVSRLDLPIKFFVLCNEGYSSIRTSQNRYFHRLVGADSSSGMTLPDLTKVASAFGLPTARISGGADLRRQIRHILAVKGPLVCEVASPADETRAPSLISTQRPDGSMVSKPLEDLWPFLDREEFRRNMIVEPLEEE